MQNSDLRLVLIKAVEEADDRLLQMLYAITKSYQQSNTANEIIPAAVTETPVEAKATKTRAYKDDRPRRVVRTYRKPRTEAAPTTTTTVAEPATRVVKEATPTRVVRVVAEKEAPKVVVEKKVDGKNRSRGSFINDLKSKTQNGLLRSEA